MSNSQGDFVLTRIQRILALRHQTTWTRTQTIMDYGWPKTCAKWQWLARVNTATIVSTTWSLTVGELEVLNPWPLAEPTWGCLGAGINPGTGTEIGCLGPWAKVYASVTVVGAWSTPTTGTLLSGEILKYGTVPMKRQRNYSPCRVIRAWTNIDRRRPGSASGLSWQIKTRTRR